MPQRSVAPRHADHPVDAIFLDRWSPRAMSGAPVPHTDLMILFEAARWAPSCRNDQPWRILYAHREGPYWPLFLGLLTDSNRLWAQHAGVLLLWTSKITFDRDGRPSRTHSFDTGAAWENLALQGSLWGYVVHGMGGFEYDRARTALGIPDDYDVEVMAAVGRPGPVEALPEEFRARESPSGRRRLEETVCEGPFRWQI